MVRLIDQMDSHKKNQTGSPRLTDEHVQHEDDSEKEIDNHHRMERPIVHIQLVVNRIVPTPHEKICRRNRTVEIPREHNRLALR
jgi:hypothetical protein